LRLSIDDSRHVCGVWRKSIRGQGKPAKGQGELELKMEKEGTVALAISWWTMPIRNPAPNPKRTSATNRFQLFEEIPFWK